MGEMAVQSTRSSWHWADKTGRHLATATAPHVPHEHEAGRTSDTAWMFWKYKKFVPLQEFEP